jgi:hypothetical protein
MYFGRLCAQLGSTSAQVQFCFVLSSRVKEAFFGACAVVACAGGSIVLVPTGTSDPTVMSEPTVKLVGV